jgi:hypothetical protein
LRNTPLQRQPRWLPCVVLVAAWVVCSAAWATGSPGSTTDASAAQYRRWIVEMKDSPRGPFTAIKWFCRDGRLLPPKDFACAGKGKGVQHGEWSDRTRQMRAQGYQVATLLAGIDAETAIADPAFANQYAQWLVERFLVAADNGWVLRKAQFYRGAIQEEDERDGARRLLTAMAAQPDWSGRRFVALRTGARLLPHGADDASAAKVRNLAAALADRDAGFQPLRVKIHGSPDASDAAAVRAWAQQGAHAGQRDEALALAAEIDRVHAGVPMAKRLADASRSLGKTPGRLPSALEEAQRLYAAGPTAEQRLFYSAELLMHLRDGLPRATPAQRLAIVDLSLAVELEHFNAAGELQSAGGETSRRTLIQHLRAGNDASYGTGLIGRRQYLELDGQLSRLNNADTMALAEYLPALRTAALLPSWGTQTLKMQFGEAMSKLGEIEPKAELFIQDQVRGSPLLFYSQRLDRLWRDANRLAGVQHKLLGKEIGAGFNALNPGLARGVLHSVPDMKAVDAFRADGIYLLPETVSDLPPLAGILTAGAGNPLSHVQLLARNLGIPNVAVDPSLLPELQRSDGRRIVLAVSRAGLVEINEDGPQWDAAFGKQLATEQNVMFEPDVAKLDLTRRDFISLRELRAADSGRLVGPKAAKLGELMSHFPDRVAPGVGIPFGLYREAVLDRPYKGSSKTVYQWMVESFRKLEAMPVGSAEAARASEQLRTEIYSIVNNTDPGPRFRERLRAAMAREFGAGFNGGVFIRSDTNVEDLPGFTGAGLNLTLFNVVGFENVVKGIAEVWASPYTARAWAWRQSHMKGPEHVYPAVLLQRTVPSDISGVMITQDVDNADLGVLSVAVNEGVGGAVDGQASESVRIDRRNGNVRLLAVSTAPRRLAPLPTSGIAKRPSTGADTLLQPQEIAQLMAFADEIPRKFPQVGEDGKPVAADVEFGFVGGRLWLLQIRPFNESRQARSAAHLAEMDRTLAGNLSRRVNLKEALQ